MLTNYFGNNKNSFKEGLATYTTPHQLNNIQQKSIRTIGISHRTDWLSSDIVTSIICCVFQFSDYFTLMLQNYKVYINNFSPFLGISESDAKELNL